MAGSVVRVTSAVLSVWLLTNAAWSESVTISAAVPLSSVPEARIFTAPLVSFIFLNVSFVPLVSFIVLLVSVSLVPLVSFIVPNVSVSLVPLVSFIVPNVYIVPPPSL